MGILEFDVGDDEDINGKDFDLMGGKLVAVPLLVKMPANNPE